MRCFSSATAIAVGKKYSKDRTVYNKQITELRKKWKDSHDLNKKRLEEEKIQENEKFILERAILLRKKKADAEARQLVHLESQKILNERKREKIAKRLVRYEKSQQDESQRYEKLIKDIGSEQKAWITPSNIETVITEQLFATQATTGLVTKHSEHWRWNVIAMNPKRVLSQEFIRDYVQRDTTESRMKFKGQSRAVKKMLVQDILDPMIGTGEERAKYRELVDQFTEVFEDKGGFEQVDDYFNFLLEFQESSSNAYDGGYDSYDNPRARDREEDGGESDGAMDDDGFDDSEADDEGELLTLDDEDGEPTFNK